MPASFVVYIDESGDEGFKFTSNNRSSSWFVLAAVVVRKCTEPDIVPLMRDVRAKLGKPDTFTLHFQKLQHTQRIPLIHEISQAHLRVVAIACYKPDLNATRFLKHKHHLYFYLTRFLFERVSWLCRDYHTADNPGDGSAEIIFSNRSSMSYTEIKDYMRRLRTRGSNTAIYWPAIKPDQIIAIPHRLRAGLQVADAVASGFWYAFETSPYGFTEDKYAKMLLRVAYKHKDSHNGYGIKIWPKEAAQNIRKDARYAWITTAQ